MTDPIRETALREASVPTLLMCLAQITGDHRWLEEPFRPQRDISIFADPTGGLPEPVQQIVRDGIAQVLDELADGRRKLPPLPDEARVTEMMNVCVGEKVPTEYAVMALEEMGFRDRLLGWSEPERPPQRRLGFRVLVVGAGFSGIAAGRQLKDLDIPFDIVEKHASRCLRRLGQQTEQRLDDRALSAARGTH